MTDSVHNCVFRGTVLFHDVLQNDVPSALLENAGHDDSIKDKSDGVSFESICTEVIGKKQTAQLRRLLDFRFIRHPSINLPEERLQAIEKHIEVRARELLSLPKNRKK